MDIIAALLLLNCSLSGGCLLAVVHHHWNSIKSPRSAANLLLAGLTDLRTRVMVLDLISKQHETRLKKLEG